MHTDLILTGPVWTGTAERPWAAAIAISEGRILAIGTAAECVAASRAGVPVQEAAGVIIPAFHDAHTHLVEGAMFDVRCNLHDLGPDELEAEVARYSAELAPDSWVRGGGWSMDDFVRRGVDRDALDRLAGGRPAYLTARDGHSAWVSSAALELAGITAETRVPAGGRIEYRSDGSPSGILHETAMALVKAVLPDTTSAEWAAAYDLGERTLHSLGIVGWQDARVENDILEAYLDAERRGALRSRVALALAWDRHRGIEQLDELIDMRHRLADSSLLSAPTVKVFVDGVLENRTATMIAGYADGAEAAEPLVPSTSLEQILTECTRAGFGVHLHAVGDGAVRIALDACAAARQEHPGHQMRHQICHLQSVHPDDVPRFGELGVIANIQPLWACADTQMLELCAPGLGEERFAGQYPFRSIALAGGLLAGGSDWRVSTPNPLPQIEVAITRRAPGNLTDEPLAPAERLELTEALTAFTAGSAFANGVDDESGTLEVGKSADLVVLEDDPWHTAASKVGEISVLATMFRGEWVYSADTSEARDDAGPEGTTES